MIVGRNFVWKYQNHHKDGVTLLCLSLLQYAFHGAILTERQSHWMRLKSFCYILRASVIQTSFMEGTQTHNSFMCSPLG